MGFGTAPCVRYTVDVRASQFTVQAFASGLVAAIAHSPKIAIRDWTGECEIGSSLLADASLRVNVKAASLEVLDELRENDRREIHRVMKEEVLETAYYPDIVFESSQVKTNQLKDDLYRFQARGALSLHGITNDHTFSGQAAFGDNTVRAYGEFMVRQTDYNIRIASIAGGTLKLQNDLKFSFYIVARKG